MKDHTNSLAEQLKQTESEVTRALKASLAGFGEVSSVAQAMKAVTDQGRMIDSLGVSAAVPSGLANAFESTMFTSANSVFSAVSGLDDLFKQVRQQLSYVSEIARYHESIFRAAIPRINIPDFSFPVFPKLEIPAFPRIDWDEARRAHHDAAVRIADLGWTTPSWITLPDLRQLASASDEKVNAFFLNCYLHPEPNELKPIAEQLLQSPRMAQWRSMLEEVFACIGDGKYRVCVPALISTLEGFIAESLCQLNQSPRRRVNISAGVKGTKWHEVDDFTGLLWKSVVVFLANLFAASDFEGAPPRFINRHWILHGRAVTEWGATDALKLVNALATVHWLFE
jgi:hypothetical protein